MSLNEAIAHEISAIKELVSEIDNHTYDSRFFYELARQVEWLAKDIDRCHSGYYVGIISFSSRDTFYRIYYPLGLMTEIEAYKIMNNELIEDPQEVVGIKEVSKEELNKYYNLITLQEIYDNLNLNKYAIQDILANDFMDELQGKIDKLREDLGFKFHWEHVESRFQ